ncbi:DUF3089 domain-containing protein [Nocardia sp. NPDC003482]
MRLSTNLIRRLPGRRAALLILAALVWAGAGPVAAPAHADPDATVWLCRPDLTDPCDLPGDTTDLGTGQVSAPAPVAEDDKPVDCFYIYPTVAGQLALTQDRVVLPEVASIAEYQAARFSGLCRVFAPVYRQATLVGLQAAMAGVDALSVGYRDVEAAWADYLAHDNHGRGVIIVSHSQGTLVARKLIREHIDPDSALRERLVGAFLMGGNVTTARGGATGGDFASIPLCTDPGEAGCVVAYSLSQSDPLLSLFGSAQARPGQLSNLWGLPTGPGYEVACTDPGMLSGDYSPQPVTVPTRPFAPGTIAILNDYTMTPPATVPASSWMSTAARTAGRCHESDLGYRFYKIDPPAGAAINELPLFESHLLDINYGYDRLLRIAAAQIRTWQRGR